ncbi:helix-turn-helix domain-containing protein [Deinococcus peraridilitoris]|uniref:helix-turn-helix domain-containing protein n=1 Tax=Deinococcus peraridilitoris TaxID=432329 RepID=UPI00031ED98C
MHLAAASLSGNTLSQRPVWRPRAEGRVGGRRPKLKPHQQQEIVNAVREGRYTPADAARLFNVHPATISRLLAAARTST